MFLLASQPVAQVPAEVAAKAGTTLIESGVLGTLLVVSILANVALVWLAFRAMNLRVEDTKKIAELSEKMVTTFSSVNGTLASLNNASQTQANALQALTSTMNTVLMSALASRGIGPGHSQLPPPSSGGHT